MQLAEPEITLSPDKKNQIMELGWQEFERLESMAIALPAAFVFFEVIGGSALLFIVLILAPDISMVGYLKNEEIGALIYNSFHNYLPPATFLIYSFLNGQFLIQQIALIWIMHIAGDRTLGYGLKKPEGFKKTHLRNL